jgi:hypothetical protein
VAGDLMRGKREMREMMDQKQRIAAEINDTQDVIVSLRSRIEAAHIRDKAQIFDDEADILKQEMAAKAKYRELYQALLKVQTDINAMKENCAVMRAALLSSFEDWHRMWETNELYPEKVVPPKTEVDLGSAGKDFGKTKSKTPVKPIKPKIQPKGRK